MSDYTPSTEKIAEAWQYANGVCDCCRNGFHKSDYEAFNRWLAEIKADAWEQGFEAGEMDAHRPIGHQECTPNPYRTNQEDTV